MDRKVGATTRVSGNLFKAGVKAVLIFGSETWVMKPHVGWDMGGSNIGRMDRLWENNLCRVRTEDGSNPPWRRKCRRYDWSR